MIETILLTATRVLTFNGNVGLTNATGFFFQRDERLFLVTSRHVMIDPPHGHLPTRVEIELHVDPNNMAKSVQFSIPLYDAEMEPLWRQGIDGAGEIDVAAIQIDRSALPPTAVYRAFTPRHLQDEYDEVDVGTSLIVVGFPLGFHDVLHHMAVVRQAVIASSFGLRFEGRGYFLTDARTHRGTSGAAVVMRIKNREAFDDLPWKILGVHSARLDAGNRDMQVDEILGLNAAWYADILMTLTERV